MKEPRETTMDVTIKIFSSSKNLIYSTVTLTPSIDITTNYNDFQTKLIKLTDSATAGLSLGTFDKSKRKLQIRDKKTRKAYQVSSGQ